MMRQYFVVGKNRSGTKWLSNILARHPSVAAIQREGAGGILESNLFLHYPRMFGDLSIRDNRLAFLSCLRNDNFFRLSGLDERWLHGLAFEDYLDVLEALMDEYARRQAASAWVQKADSLVLDSLLDRFPRARFVIIQRQSVADNVASNLALHANDARVATRPGQLLKEVMSYHHHRKIQDRRRNLPHVHVVSMETLKARRDETVQDVCAFLDLPFAPEMLEDAYRPNTSYKGQRTRRDSLGPREETMVAVWDRAVKHMPLPAIGAFFRLWHGLPASRSPERLQPRTFSTFADEIEGDRPR